MIIKTWNIFLMVVVAGFLCTHSVFTMKRKFENNGTNNDTIQSPSKKARCSDDVYTKVEQNNKQVIKNKDSYLIKRTRIK